MGYTRTEAIGLVAHALLAIRAEQRPLGPFNLAGRQWLVEHGLAKTTDGLFHFSLTPLGIELANHLDAYLSQLLTAKKQTGQLRRIATNGTEEEHHDTHEQGQHGGESTEEQATEDEAPEGYVRVDGQLVHVGRFLAAVGRHSRRSGSKARKAKGTTTPT